MAATLPERIRACLARHPEWDNRRVAQANKTTIGAVIAARIAGPVAPPPPPGPPPPASKGSVGVSLSGCNVFLQRPQDRAKGLLYGLSKGRGFPVKELAVRWGMSEETITAHAKRFECFRYVETEPGRYLACVLHPDTAKSYGG